MSSPLSNWSSMPWWHLQRQLVSCQARLHSPCTNATLAARAFRRTILIKVGWRTFACVDAYLRNSGKAYYVSVISGNPYYVSITWSAKWRTKNYDLPKIALTDNTLKREYLAPGTSMSDARTKVKDGTLLWFMLEQKQKPGVSDQSPKARGYL